MRQDPSLKDVVISCDTYFASVAKASVTAGADIVNDVSGGALDPAMLAQVAELGVPYVLMHMRGGDLASMQHPSKTHYGCVWSEVGGELQAAADRAMLAGIPAWNIILDPGGRVGVELQPRRKSLMGVSVVSGQHEKSQTTLSFGVENVTLELGGWSCFSIRGDRGGVFKEEGGERALMSGKLECSEPCLGC